LIRKQTHQFFTTENQSITTDHDITQECKAKQQNVNFIYVLDFTRVGLAWMTGKLDPSKDYSVNHNV
jgi:hypothetical protein